MHRRSFQVVFILPRATRIHRRSTSRISLRVEKSGDRIGPFVSYVATCTYLYMYTYIFYIYGLKRSGAGSNEFELPKKAGSTHGSISDGLGRIRRGIRNRFGHQPALLRSIATFRMVGAPS